MGRDTHDYLSALRLEEGVLIGVTAPSSGVPNDLHKVLKAALSRMEQRGFQVTSGETAWTQSKAKSAPALIRAAELNRMIMRDTEIDLIIPPWGGEWFLETLEYIDFENMKKKWVLGYSDISGLLPSITLKTGMAKIRVI